MLENTSLPESVLPSSPQKKKNFHIPIIVGTFFILLGVLFYFSYFTPQRGPLIPTPTIEPTVQNDQEVPLNVVPTSSIINKEIPGQLVIKVSEEISEEQLVATLKAYNASIKTKLPTIHTYVLIVPAGQELVISKQLQTAGVIRSAERDYVQSVQMVPNDTYFQNQWGLHNTGQAIRGRTGVSQASAHVTNAWDISQGTGIKVAVLDTGIDLTQTDIAAKVVAQKTFVTNTIDDKYGHGTHIAGTIAAETNNNRGIAGVCSKCQLVIGKVMGDDGNGDASQVAEAIIWAVDNGAHIINSSLGGTEFTQIQADAVAYAWEKGVVIVAAAGNEGQTTKFYPCAFTNVVCVAATDNLDGRFSFSNYGTWVSLAAPGENIFATLPTHAFGMQSEGPLQTNYDYISGTSMAAAVVSGVAALVWDSSYGGANAAVVQRLYGTADKIEGTGTSWQYGRVNAEKAVGYTKGPVFGIVGDCQENEICPNPKTDPGIAQTNEQNKPVEQIIEPNSPGASNSKEVVPDTSSGASGQTGQPTQMGERGLIYRFLSFLIELLTLLLSLFK